MKWFDIKNRNYWRVSGKKEYTIQEVSDLTGITVRTLRNYIKGYEEVLSPKRGYYNSLVFSELDIRTFVMIKTCIKDGFKQEDILIKVRTEQESIQKQLDEEARIRQARAAEELPQAPQDHSTEPSLATNPHLPAAVSEVALNDATIKQIGKYFLNLEQRNILLENRLERMERMLESQLEIQNQGLLPRTINLIKESSQAFWQAISRSL